MTTGSWYIDRDYITKGINEVLEDDGVLETSVGIHSKSWKDSDRKDPETVRFRALDDDGEVYFGGYLLESEDGESAGEALLSYVMHDAGAVCIETRSHSREPWEGYMG